MKIDWIDKLRYYLHTLAFCLAVSAVQYAFQPDRPYEWPLVYSIFIGTCTWALIDFGRHLFPSSRETGWPQGAVSVALPAVGIVAGYVLGTLLGDAWFGWSSWRQHGLPQLRISVLISTLAGTTGTYYFYTRNKSAYLETKMSEARHQAAEARLKLLETQIEPHMLFNTLANLRALIATDPAAARNLLDRMNDYLRATLKASRATLHPLQTEFDRLRDYLELMAIRMGPRLHYKLDLPADLADRSVPPLLLQPLVENCIKHGLEPRVEGGSILVAARLNGNTLMLEVSDTGVGLPDATDTATYSNPADGGFGLAQVRERLVTAYGPLATISLLANQPNGTQVVITFPSREAPKS